MKTLALLVVVVAVAHNTCGVTGQTMGMGAGVSAGAGVGAGAGHGAGAGVGGATGRAGGLFNFLPEPRNYGPKVYGQGHLNRFALPPNPFSISRAVHLANNFPNTLVRLDMDGDVTLTDRFGREKELVGLYGQEIEID